MNKDHSISNTNPPGEHAVAEGLSVGGLEQIDLIVSRLADGQGGERDWGVFNALAEAHPSAWRTLAQAQRQHAAMSIAVGVALHACERVELPRESGVGVPERIHERHPESGRAHRSHGRAGVRSLPTWAGWAVAAGVGLMWVTSGVCPLINPLPTGGGAGGGVSTAGISPAYWSINTPEDAVQAYLDVGGRNGSVVGELPQRMLVESRPVVGGKGVEVVFIRQFVERAIVTDLVRFGQDESGRPVPLTVPVQTSFSVTTE